MSHLIWPPIVVLAAALQTARNALQRGIMDTAGPWGATLVRFLFGLPFALVWYAGWELATRNVNAHAGPGFVIACAIAAAGQSIATASLLVSMRRSGFAIGSIFQQARLPLGAVIGVLLGDALGFGASLGVVVATLGLVLLSWPRGARLGAGDWSAATFGFSAGALFAISSNAVRWASRDCAPGHPWLGAAATLVVVQAMQTVGISLWLLFRDRSALRAALVAWRRSVGAGFCGFAASALWFTAFGMAPAAPVQAVGVVEIPIAAWAGRRLFQERLTLHQLIGAGLTAAGVTACALGTR